MKMGVYPSSFFAYMQMIKAESALLTNIVFPLIANLCIMIRDNYHSQKGWTVYAR